MSETKKAVREGEHDHGATVAAAQNAMPTGQFLNELSDFFRVFADPTRVKILMALDRDDLCVCCLADLLGMTKSAVSHQLSALRRAHLVTYRREGKNIRYSLADAHVRQIIECASEHLREPD